QPASGEKILRVGLIGAGGIAGTHTENYKTMKDVDVVCACDVSEAGLKKFGEKFGVTRLYPEWKSMLAANELDAVSVCTPNGLHCQPTIDALNAGCNVLVEKPLAMNAKEGEKMLAAAKKNKKHLVIGFQHRFEGKSKVIRRAFDEGVFGKVLFVRIQ